MQLYVMCESIAVHFEYVTVWCFFELVKKVTGGLFLDFTWLIFLLVVSRLVLFIIIEYFVHIRYTMLAG